MFDYHSRPRSNQNTSESLCCQSALLVSSHVCTARPDGAFGLVLSILQISTVRKPLVRFRASVRLFIIYKVLIICATLS